MRDLWRDWQEWAIIALLLGACLVLALLKYRWTGELSQGCVGDEVEDADEELLELLQVAGGLSAARWNEIRSFARLRIVVRHRVQDKLIRTSVRLSIIYPLATPGKISS